MTDEMKIELAKEFAKGVTKINQFILEYSGTTIIKDSEEDKSEKRDYKKFSKEDLANIILDMQIHFWGNSSYAVLFCILRDFYGYPDNRTQYEKDMQALPYGRKPSFDCTTGVVSSTFSDNPFMKLPVDKCEQNGASERVTHLVEKAKIALDAHYI